MTARPAPDEEIELTEDDVEYVDFLEYPGEVTSEFVMEDEKTPIYCRYCATTVERCKCRR